MSYAKPEIYSRINVRKDAVRPIELELRKRMPGVYVSRTSAVHYALDRTRRELLRAQDQEDRSQHRM